MIQNANHSYSQPGDERKYFWKQKHIFDKIVQNVISFHVQRTLRLFLHPLQFMSTSKTQNLIASVVAEDFLLVIICLESFYPLKIF